MDNYEFDLYESLAIAPDASEEEIRRAYRKLALVHHPDRNGGSESEFFLQLKTAYDVLIDVDRRRNYDAFHQSKEFVRDRRPLTAKEAAWLVDQQKRAWGVKEIHPFAVCILCESCPCPADGICYACGMTFCQMCVRRMHCNGKTQPHYPCRNSSAFSEKLVAEGKEKDRERRLLKGSDNKWLMADEEFRRQRDVFKDRARRGAAELCQYWAWGQTRYSVHIAVWLASADCEADVSFGLSDEGKQTIRVAPSGGMSAVLDGVFAHGVDEHRAGDALFFKHMHVMTFCLAKASPGERWHRLLEGQADGVRELQLGEPLHVVAEEQVGGFKPVHHSRVAGRLETASEWHEVSVCVPLPTMAERQHVSATISAHALEVRVAGLLEWRRGLQQRVLTWEDGHVSRTHVDTGNSTWLMATDDAGRKCVQFVLAQWMEGANRTQEDAIRKQLEKDGLRFLTEDADPLHMLELVECEMWLRAGAVFKPRAQLSEAAEALLQEMERHEEREGRPAEGLRASPLADMWLEPNSDGRLVMHGDGGDVDSAVTWYEAEKKAELEEWNEAVAGERASEARRRADAAAAAKVAAERAAEAAAATRERADKEAALRRKQMLREQKTMANAMAEARGEGVAPSSGKARKELSAAEVREMAASAARAQPLAPKRLDAALSAAPTAVAAPAAHEAEKTGETGATHSLAKCGYWFEDAGDVVKLTVPLADACAAGQFSKELVECAFTRTGFRLQVRLANGVHVLAIPELAYFIDPEACSFTIRSASKRVALSLAKQDPKRRWSKLTPL